jgi:hypothetical protein
MNSINQFVAKLDTLHIYLKIKFAQKPWLKFIYKQPSAIHMNKLIIDQAIEEIKILSNYIKIVE